MSDQRTIEQLVEPLIDNVNDMRTVHDMRRLTGCEHCKGVGDKQQMVWGVSGHDAGKQFHTQCYLRRYGFDAVLQLSSAERGKFRLCDLSAKQMRKLLSIQPRGDEWDDQP